MINAIIAPSHFLCYVSNFVFIFSAVCILTADIDLFLNFSACFFLLLQFQALFDTMYMCMNSGVTFC